MILSFSEFWSSMEFIEKLYWCFAIPFSILFVIQMILTFFGGDVDSVEADGDPSVENDLGIDFQFLTLKNLVAFFTIFGWTGVACLNSNYSPTSTVIVSSLSGTIMMTIMASIAYFMGKLTDDGTLQIKNAIGKTATVYLTIPANKKGMGKVQIKIQGLRTLDAFTSENEDIKTGAIVKVVEIINDEFLLVKQI